MNVLTIPRSLPEVLLILLTGCAAPHATAPSSSPNLAPERQPAGEALQLESSQLSPMYREVLAVDLATVMRIAQAQNLEIRTARQRVEGAQGRLESAVGGALPVLVPTALLEHVEGTVRATPGDLVGVGFNTFQASALVQWAVNPGKVFYDIVAARKRLMATEHQERAVVLETTRLAMTQFYELVRLQARVSAAHQAVSEAEELLRISELRVRTGSGVPADKLRAEARWAERRQDLIAALKAFYDASIDLTLTLHLDASVTLVPGMDTLAPQALVRDELTLDDLLAVAFQFRPDLESVRTLVEAVRAERGATWWGALGPQFQVGYQYGGITGDSNNTAEAEGIPGNLLLNPLSEGGSFNANPFANGAIKEGVSRGVKDVEGSDDETFGFADQQRATASLGWRLSFSAFGDLKTARSAERQAMIAAEATWDWVRAEVVSAQQASRAHFELIGLARQQVTSAEEALRLTQTNLTAGTMTTLDVLQAQDALSQARVRFADAVVRFNQSQVNLLAAVGLLTDSTHPTIAEAPSTIGKDRS